MINTNNSVNYTAISQSSDFQQLIKAKKQFIIPWVVFFLAFYFTLPILTAYTHFLNYPAWGAITWAWVFAFTQFIMTWVLCFVYAKKARRFDVMIANIKQQFSTDVEKPR